MTIGDKIKKIRTFRNMTQAELGAALGWGDKGANRLAQYETNYRVPRKDLVTEMAKILDVNPLALHEPTIMDASELMEILFWIDEFNPAAKNTMEDLLWMRANGLEAAVLKEAAKGKIIFGICGGYQMLGETLSDPHHVEAGGTIKGMGLLPMDTVFAEKKTRTRVSGRFLELEGELQALSGAELEGYEIHMGETVLKGEAGHSVSIEDQVSGECKEDGAYRKNVCGTYVHGVFDREDVAEAVIRVLGEKKGIDVSQMTGIDFAAFKETQYDILAAELRKHLDMKKIYDILEQGI